MQSRFHLFRLLANHIHDKQRAKPKVSNVSKSKPFLEASAKAEATAKDNGSHNLSGNGSQNGNNSGNNNDDNNGNHSDDDSHKKNRLNIMGSPDSIHQRIKARKGSRVKISNGISSEDMNSILGQQRKDDDEKLKIVKMTDHTESSVKIKYLKSKLTQQHKDYQNKLTIQKLKDKNRIQKLEAKNRDLKLESKYKNPSHQLPVHHSRSTHYGPTNHYNIVFDPRPAAYRAITQALWHPERYRMRNVNAKPSGHFINVLPNSNQNKHPVGAGITHPKMSTYSYDHDNQNPLNNDPKGPKDSGPSM